MIPNDNSWPTSGIWGDFNTPAMTRIPLPRQKPLFLYEAWVPAVSVEVPEELGLVQRPFNPGKAIEERNVGGRMIPYRTGKRFEYQDKPVEELPLVRMMVYREGETEIVVKSQAMLEALTGLRCDLRKPIANEPEEPPEKPPEEPENDPRIFGVSWDNSSSPILTRTDDAIGLVASAGVDDEAVVNDFDSLPIFGDIHDVVDNYGNVFVRIPKFYIKKTNTTGFKSWQVSEVKHDDDWYLPWCFWDFENGTELPYVDIGKYNASIDPSNRLASKSGAATLNETTMTSFRTYAHNNNADDHKGYQLFDIHAIDILRTLFFIEFATLDSQSIMYGWAKGKTGPAICGLTDDVVASSGSINSNADGNACKYRGIENLWGNVRQFIDGINFNYGQGWVCKNADQYKSDTFASPYERLSYRNLTSSGYFKYTGYDSAHPYAEFPTVGGGSNTTYYCDQYTYGSGWVAAQFGGAWDFGTYCGLSYWYLYPASYASARIGSRLMRKAL